MVGLAGSGPRFADDIPAPMVSEDEPDSYVATTVCMHLTPTSISVLTMKISGRTFVISGG